MAKLQEAGMILSNKKPAKIAGMTLVELLVVLLILTIAMAAIVKFQVSSFYYDGISRQRIIAINLAKDKIESFRAYEVLSTTSGKVAYNDISSGASSSTVNNTPYTLTWTVTTNTDPDYKTVNVIVSWTDRRNVSQSVTLSTIVAKIDPANSGVIVYG